MDVITIDGVSYDALVTEISENFNVLDSENSGRSIAAGGRMIRDPIGSFIGHKVKFRRKNNNLASYDSLFMKLAEPVDSHTIKIVHNQTTIQYDAYTTTGTRSLERVEGSRVLWGELEVDFTPMEANRTPT